MKLEQLRDKGLRANFFGYVSQDVSQLRNTVIHRLCTIEPSSICLKRIICPLCLHGRYRADDPRRGLPGISYFQTNALAAKKSRPIAAFICALLAEVFKGSSRKLYCQVSESSYQSGATEVSGESGLAK